MRIFLLTIFQINKTPSSTLAGERKTYTAFSYVFSFNNNFLNQQHMALEIFVDYCLFYCLHLDFNWAFVEMGEQFLCVTDEEVEFRG